MPILNIENDVKQIYLRYAIEVVTCTSSHQLIALVLVHMLKIAYTRILHSNNTDIA